MSLSANALSALVIADHLTTFPTAASSIRANPLTGVPPHNPGFAFIDALCAAIVPVLKGLVIMDLGVGTLDVTGIAVPVPITFPGISAAQIKLVTLGGWTGPKGHHASQIFVGSVLKNVAKLALLRMNPNPLMGSGAGVVSPASTSGLETAARIGLLAALPLAFQASGKFGIGDIPAAPLNPQLLMQLPAYADALALGIASMTGVVAYVGTATVTTPVPAAINTGVLI